MPKIEIDGEPLKGRRYIVGSERMPGTHARVFTTQLFPDEPAMSEEQARYFMCFPQLRFLVAIYRPDLFNRDHVE